jgi:transposase
MKRTIRNHTAAFKASVVLAACKGDMTLAGLAAQFGIHSIQIMDWKQVRVGDAFGGKKSPSENGAAASSYNIAPHSWKLVLLGGSPWGRE